MAPAAGRLPLEHAPAVVAGMDREIRLGEHERDVVSANLPAGAAAEGEIWELRLYVAGQTPKSLKAVENLQRMCEELLGNPVIEDCRYELEPSPPTPLPRAGEG